MHDSLLRCTLPVYPGASPDRVTDLPTPVKAKPALVEPLAPARYKVQFTADAGLQAKLERLKSLRPGSDLAALIEEAVTEKLERLESKRFGKTKAPRKKLEQTDTSPLSRYIPAPVKREVSDRDENQCTYVNAHGRRCDERGNLQFHHDDPFARGGNHSPENIQLMCPAHNAYLAECDYGKEMMKRYRRRLTSSGSDASYESPSHPGRRAQRPKSPLLRTASP